MRHIEQYLWHAYVCFSEQTFQNILIVLTPPAFCSAIFKDGRRQYKCHHFSNMKSHKEIMFTLLDSFVNSDVIGGIFYPH